MEPRYQGRGVVVWVAWEALHQRRKHPRHRCCQLGYLECKLQAAFIVLARGCPSLGWVSLFYQP